MHVFCVVLPLYNDIEVCSERAVCRRDDVHDPREVGFKHILKQFILFVVLSLDYLLFFGW